MGSTEGWEAWWTDGHGVMGLAGNASWGARGRGKESRGWGCLWASYVSVILHGLLQNSAGQLGLCPVPQPGIQGLQVGLHTGAPREVLQRGGRGLRKHRLHPGSSRAAHRHPWLTRTGAGQHEYPLCWRAARSWQGFGAYLRGAGGCSLSPHRVASPLVCMFRLQTPAPTEGSKKPLCP